jgi:hypothetical protein
MPPEVDTSADYCQWYVDDAGTSWYFMWTTPGGSTYDKAMRMDVPKNHTASVYGALFYIWESQAAFGGNSLVVTICEDVAGLPGDTIYTESFPLGEITIDDYFYFPFTTPAEVSGAENYHLCWDVDGDPGDTTWMSSDDGAHPGYGGTATPTGRGSRWYEAGLTWLSNMDYMGFDPNYEAGTCQEVFYSNCANLVMTYGLMNLWVVPDNDPAWPDGGTWNGAGQLFTAECDTVYAVKFYHFDYTGYGYFFYPSDGTNGVEITIRADDGTGSIDVSAAPLATATIPGGLANLFPQTGGDGTGAGWNSITVTFTTPPVIRGNYHVCAQMTSDDPADGALLFPINALPDNPGWEGASVNFTSPGNPWERTGVSNNWLVNGGGTEQALYIRSYFCKDEFCRCMTQKTYNAPWVWGWYVWPNGWFAGLAQKIKAPNVNRIEKVRFQIIDPAYWGEPSPVNAKLEMYVWPTGGTDYMGLPAPGSPELISELKTSLVFAPLFNEMDLTGLPGGGLQHVGDFYIGAMAVDVTDVDYYYWCTEDALGAAGENNGGALCSHMQIGGAWLDFSYWPYYDNIMAEADFCWIPPEERICLRGENWPTYGKTFARGSASLVSLGADIQGNLTKAWEYQSTSSFANNVSPVIWGDTVVYYFGDNLVALDLNTGGTFWLRPFDGFQIGAGCFSIPTVHNFAGYGEDVTMVFTAGGDTKAMTACSLSTGGTRWTKDFMFHSHHFMTYGTSVIVDCEGVPVLIYNDDNGEIYALEALTGNLYGGWGTNPVNYGGAVRRGITADGEGYVYIGLDHDQVEGDVVCIEACTGAEVWRLSTTGGLQGAILDPTSFDPYQGEGFTGGISYEIFENQPTLYVTSTYSPESDNFNSGGVVYCISATDGSLKWAKLGIAGDYAAPIVDKNHVINNGWAPWVPGYGVHRGPTAFQKTNGNILYSNTTTNPGNGDFWLLDGLLTCETEAPDWYIASSAEDFLHFYNSDNGQLMFYRRCARDYDFWHHYSPAMTDGYLVQGYIYKLFCLTEQAPRQRLDITSYRVESTIEPTDPFTCVYEEVLGNIGAAPLTIDSVILSDTSNSTIPPPMLSMVDIDRAEHMAKVAEKFASNLDEFRSSLDDDILLADDASSRRVSRNAAYALPAWLYGLVAPTPGTVIPPEANYGDSANYIDIEVSIDGTAVPRGAVTIYAFIYSDDPDYFLDSTLMEDGVNAAVPEVQLNIIGGCAYSDVTMDFGVGEANFCFIWNGTKIADGDITSWEIDGDDASFWQGSYVFAKAKYSGYTPPGKPPAVFSNRVALHAENWSSSNPGTWMSILADPNCADPTLCPPDHQTNVQIGEISNDFGASYDPLYAQVVTYAIIDSVQDCCIYDIDTLPDCDQWDWSYNWPNHEAEQPPYDDTLTMGFHACVTVIGATDEAYLNNFVVHLFDFDGRYGPVEDVAMGAMIDYDIPTSDYNVAGYDEDLSLGYAYPCNTKDNGWGMIRVPFDWFDTDLHDEMLNARTITANMGGWNDTSVWLDSVYYWMTAFDNQLVHQPGTDPAVCVGDADDREIFFSIGENIDIPETPDTYRVGIAVFGYPDIVDADIASTYQGLAVMANKLCGWSRGDLDNDLDVDIVDVCRLIDFVYYSGNGPYPFKHLGDVDASGGAPDGVDCQYLLDYVLQFPSPPYPPPVGKWEL